MFGPISRVTPQGRPQDYTTFAGRMPAATHSRPATCEEYGCPMRRDGWASRLDERGNAKHAEAARWIRSKVHGRVFTEARGDDGITSFTFPPGQECFASGRHRVPNGRPQRLLIARGDWREYARPQETGVSEWQGRLHEHVDQLIIARQKG